MAKAILIPGDGVLSFTNSGGLEQTIKWSDLLPLIDEMVTHRPNVGMTADLGASQGDGVITSRYNVYSSVAAPGDAVTLPDVFEQGERVYVKNDDIQNFMNVFPAAGHNAGEGTDIPVMVDEGGGVLFLATVANSAWTKILDF